ncbi:MAG: hypothetical protein IKO52_12675 [Clostridia bacterium]|nr:hypothetical protein [Clostridia bacterium]
MRGHATMDMTEGKPLRLLSVFALPLFHFTAIGVWSIWITAGLTWMLAGVSCLLRYASWRKKTKSARNVSSESGSAG